MFMELTPKDLFMMRVGLIFRMGMRTRKMPG